MGLPFVRESSGGDLLEEMDGDFWGLMGLPFVKESSGR